MNIVQRAESISRAEKSTRDKKAAQREHLIDCAERTIRTGGLGALRARDLARDMGCAVGALYNLVADMDELVLLVARRTAADLGAALDAAADPEASHDAVLIAWAHAYFHFARDNHARWRALFEFRMPAGAFLPDWFEAVQAALFARLDTRLAPFLPSLDPEAQKLKARILFSAIHGIVALALEEKFEAMPLAAIDAELTAFVQAYLRGCGKEEDRRAF